MLLFGVFYQRAGRRPGNNSVSTNRSVGVTTECWLRCW